MYIDCPKCDKQQELDHDDLPRDACDDSDYECKFYEHVFSIGWSSEAEVRDDYLDKESDAPS